MKKIFTFLFTGALLCTLQLNAMTPKKRKLLNEVNRIAFAIKAQEIFDRQFNLLNNYTQEYFTIIEDPILDSEEKIERLEDLRDSVEALELIPSFTENLITQITRFIEAVQ